jgi:uncharacterized membrane protein
MGVAYKRILLCLAFSAMLVSGYLAWTAGWGAAPAGCGTESGCGQVLASHWSRLLGMPVSLLGFALHFTAVIGVLHFPVSDLRRSLIPRMLVIVCMVGLGGAVWFVFVQAVLLKHFCVWCMVVHGLATTYCLMYLGMVLSQNNPNVANPGSNWVTPRQFGKLSLSGIVFVLSLIILQMIQPDHSQAPVVKTDETNIQVPQSQSPRGRTVRLYDDQVTLFVDELPSLGKTDAVVDVLFLYDYCCPTCREFHRELRQMLDHSAEIRMTLLPVPIHSECNEYWQLDDSEFANSCDLIKLALAMRRLDQAKFVEFDDWLCAGPTRTTKEAFDRAGKLVGVERLTKTLEDPWIAEMLQAATRVLKESNSSSVPTFLPLTDQGLKMYPSRRYDLNVPYRGSKKAR